MRWAHHPVQGRRRQQVVFDAGYADDCLPKDNPFMLQFASACSGASGEYNQCTHAQTCVTFKHAQLRESGLRKVRSKCGQNGPGRMRDIKHLYKIREVEPITASAVVPSQSKVETKDARMTRSIVHVVCVRASLALRPTEADVHRLGCMLGMMLGMAVRAEYFGRAERTQQIAYHSQDWQCQIASSWPWHARTQPPQYRS